MELWHALNRGVEKRNIFLDDRDRFRFVHGLVLFNTARPANNTTFIIESDINDFVNRYKDERIVDIHGWCLMRNHYHLLLSGRTEGGVSLFLRKLNVGYANYFNSRYERSGALFQGRTKKKHIDNDAYFLHILNYIHFNPLDLHAQSKHWRQREIKDARAALQRLETYRWSSYLDYCGKANFPSVLTTDLYRGVFTDVQKSTEKYLRDIEINVDYVLEDA